MTSQDAAEKLSSGTVSDSIFLANYLHAGYQGTCDKFLALEVVENPQPDTLYTFFSSGCAPANQISLDVLSPEGSASPMMKYAYGFGAPTDSVAGIRYAGDFKVVLFGFGLEGADSCGQGPFGHPASGPELVMQRVLNWLRGTSDVPEWEEESVNRPKDILLGQNHPNPFNPITNIQFSVYGGQRPTRATLKVYNIVGRLVRTLVDEEMLPGVHSVTWDGKDDRGNEVSSGVYFYQLKARDQAETKKMVLLK